MKPDFELECKRYGGIGHSFVNKIKIADYLCQAASIYLDEYGYECIYYNKNIFEEFLNFFYAASKQIHSAELCIKEEIPRIKECSKDDICRSLDQVKAASSLCDTVYEEYFNDKSSKSIFSDIDNFGDFLYFFLSIRDHISAAETFIKEEIPLATKYHQTRAYYV